MYWLVVPSALRISIPGCRGDESCLGLRSTPESTGDEPGLVYTDSDSHVSRACHPPYQSSAGQSRGCALSAVHCTALLRHTRTAVAVAG